MSAEMSAASATYAQWLDDQTQVSAKDLVKSLTLYLSVSLSNLCFSVWLAYSEYS